MVAKTGTANADQLQGTATADTLSGLAGNDKLEGHAGIDVLTGGLGADELIGEADVIVLKGTSITNFTELQAHFATNGGFTYIFTDGDNDANNALDGDVIIISTPGPTAYTPLASHFQFLP
jgi:Ca2+-binding RTX toxin-like protein